MTATFIKLRISGTKHDAFFNLASIDRFDVNDDGGFDIEYRGEVVLIDTDPRDAEFVELPDRGTIGEHRKRLNDLLALKQVIEEAKTGLATRRPQIENLKSTTETKRFVSKKRKN